MVNYAIVTKLLLLDANDVRSDSTTGSTAKAVTDYIESIDSSKTIRSITAATVSNTSVLFTIIHDS